MKVHGQKLEIKRNGSKRRSFTGSSCSDVVDHVVYMSSPADNIPIRKYLCVVVSLDLCISLHFCSKTYWVLL